MSEPDIISYIISFLKQYNYPLIHSMSSEEISDIFHISNRCFLISWVLKLMDEETYLPILEDKEHDKEFLANVICSHGFCSEKEKLEFFNGDLPATDHVLILYRIFKFVDNLKKSSLQEEESLPLDTIDSLINLNLNIFPGFGDIKSLTQKEKTTRIQIMQQEIQTLQAHVEHNESIENTNVVVTKTNKDLENVLNDLKENLSQFGRVVKAIEKDKSTAVKSDYKIDPQSGELLEKCNKNLSIISQYINNLSTINNFNIEEGLTLTDNITPLINLLAEQVQEISKVV